MKVGESWIFNGVKMAEIIEILEELTRLSGLSDGEQVTVYIGIWQPVADCDWSRIVHKKVEIHQVQLI